MKRGIVATLLVCAIAIASDRSSAEDSAGDCQDMVTRARALQLEAERGGAGAREAWRGAGWAYFDAWRKYGEPAIVAKRPPMCAMDGVLESAARAFEKAGEPLRALQAWRRFVDPKLALPPSAAGTEALERLGEGLRAFALFDQAADYYEKHAEAARQTAGGSASLAQAAMLQLALGRSERMMVDLRAHVRTYGKGSAILALVVAEHLVDAEEWDLAKEALAAARIDAEKFPGAQIRAHVARARMLAARSGAAEQEYEAARKLWAAHAEKVRAGAAEDMPADAVARATDAAAAAFLFFADRARR